MTRRKNKEKYYCSVTLISRKIETVDTFKFVYEQKIRNNSFFLKLNKKQFLRKRKEEG